MTEHRYKAGQKMIVDNELYCGRVEIVVLDDDCCDSHDLPRYGCRAGDAAFTFCEDELKPSN
jgi:hypothetical protein